MYFLKLFAIFFCQILMVFFRQRNVVMINMKKKYASVLLVVSSALGIQGFLEGDYVAVVVYILGGAFGSYLSFLR